MKKILGSILFFCLVILTPAFAFSDVSLNFWAYDKIDQMYKSGVISGFEDGTFRPDESITREQAAAIFTNFFELTQKEEAKKFVDVLDGYWSEEYNQIVSQYMPIDELEGKYYFRPQDFAKRVEIAETVSKIIGLEAEGSDLDIINNFNDKEDFSEEDKKYIALVAKNGIMVGDDKSQFRPNDTITRAEFCALIYNIYLIKNDLKDQEMEKTVMTINGEQISVSDFNLYFGLQKKVYEAMLGSSDIWNEEIEGKSLYEIVKDATKEGIIAEKVKVQKAKQLGIELSAEEKNEIEAYATSSVGSEICGFYGITPEQLVKVNSEGKMVYELSRVMYENSDHTNHNHVDINAEIDTIKYDARHILLSTEGLLEEDKLKVKEKAQGLLDRIKNGEDFATLADEYTEDPGSKGNGGLYENIGLGEFVSEFEEAALAVGEGTVYPELVESPYGYHIVKLEKKIETKRTLTDDEKQEIMSAELEETSKEWINNATIELNDAIYKAI